MHWKGMGQGRKGKERRKQFSLSGREKKKKKILPFFAGEKG